MILQLIHSKKLGDWMAGLEQLDDWANAGKQGPKAAAKQGVVAAFAVTAGQLAVGNMCWLELMGMVDSVQRVEVAAATVDLMVAVVEAAAALASAAESPIAAGLLESYAETVCQELVLAAQM